MDVLFRPNVSSHLSSHAGPEPKKGEKNEIPWCFSQVKGTIEDEVADG